MNHPKHEQYLEALRRAARVPVIFQSDIGTMFPIVSALQLALRHPGMSESGSPAAAARDFIEDFKEQLRQRDPLLVELVELGEQPEHDT